MPRTGAPRPCSPTSPAHDDRSRGMESPGKLLQSSDAEIRFDQPLAWSITVLAKAAPGNLLRGTPGVWYENEDPKSASVD